MIQTKNFNPEIDKKLICTCGHILCDKRSVSQETLDRTQLVRNKYGKPLRVNSGGRCQYHPDEQGRTTPADHQLCQGIDISVKGALMRGELLQLALDAGFNAIGVYTTFLHLARREDCKLVVWVK